MLSPELMKVIHEEREREIQAAIRRRQIMQLPTRRGAHPTRSISTRIGRIRLTLAWAAALFR